MEIETKLRKFISEILNPFNDRINQLNKDMKDIKTNQTYCSQSVLGIQTNLNSFSTVKDQLAKLHTDIHA